MIQINLFKFYAAISNLLMLLVSYLGYGLIGLSIAVLIVTLFNALLIFGYVKKHYMV